MSHLCTNVICIMEFIPAFDSSIILYLFVAFAVFASIQLLYVLFIHARLAFYRMDKQPINTEMPPVTIIIAARNESDNLFKHLPIILEQNYPEYEVIVVNHQSMDDSNYILSAFQMEYSYLKVIHVEKNPHLLTGKKLPLTLGVKAAKYEHLVFTDADCQPKSNLWLQKMVGTFSEKKSIVLGYGPYYEEKGFLNKIIRFDTAFIALNYFSFALSKMPYMGVGRNLAYTKEVFNSVKGFKSHYSILSGDDDLFIQETAKNKNYSIQLAEDSFCYSEPETTWKSWVQQKSRHYSTSVRYKVINKALLGIYPLTLLMFWISFVILMFDSEYRWISLAYFVLVVSVKWWIQGRCMLKLKAKSFILLLPFLDLFYALLIPSMYYATEKSTNSKWK